MQVLHVFLSQVGTSSSELGKVFCWRIDARIASLKLELSLVLFLQSEFLEVFAFVVAHLAGAALQPLLVFEPFSVDIFSFPLRREGKHFHSVGKDSKLDFSVELRVATKARRLVDFDQPGPSFLVYENVEAKHLKAQRLFNVLRLRGLVHMCD